MAILLPNGKQQYFATSDGAPLVGGKVYTYEAGTTTPKATYSDADATASNTNPVILDARGEATIFWSGAYKVVVKDSLDNTIYTVDDISTIVDMDNIVYDGESIAVILEERLSHVVDDIDALKAVDSTKYANAYVRGYYAPGDGGGGHYWFDSGDTTTADNGGTVIVGSDSARWKLDYKGSVTMRQFGAVDNYTQDSTNAVQAAIAWSGENGVPVYVDGAFLITDTLQYYDNTVIIGCASDTITTNTAITAIRSAFILDDTAASAPANTALYNDITIDGVCYIKSDFMPGGSNPLPFLTTIAASNGVAAFSGAALWVGSVSGVVVRNCIFVGFEYVNNFDASWNYTGGINFSNVIFDCTHGIKLVADTTVVAPEYPVTVHNCRAYPLTTSNLTDDDGARTGNAFYFSGGDYVVSDCYAFGHAVGFYSTGAKVRYVGCEAKNYDASNTKKGFSVNGSGFPAVISACVAENCGGAGIYVNTPASGGLYYDTSITVCTLLNASSSGCADGQVWFYDGYGSIANSYFGGNTGIGAIKLNNNAGQVNIDNISVPGDVAPIFGTAANILLSRIGNITYRQAAPVLQPMTWTPVVKCGTTVQTGTWYGTYTVTNNYVTCYFSLSFSGGAPAGGTMTVEGLPYTCVSGGSYTSVGRDTSGCSFYANLTAAGFPHFAVSFGTSVMDCYYATATGSTVLAHGQLNNNTVIRGSVTYKIIT